MRIPQSLMATLTLAVLLFALPVPAQLIHTVAGGGPPQGVVATSASIAAYSPAVDAGGNIYFPSGNAVYKMDTTDHLTRLAGQTVDGIFQLGANGTACPTAADIGDGGPAASAVLNGPLAVALDAAGNLYIADSYSCRVRVVNMQTSTIIALGVTIAPGNIATVAGSATYGSGGDNGPATSAQLFQPSGVAVDSSGNLYIADTGNSRVRKVNTSGTITTIAGNGTRGCVGDGLAATGAELNSPVEVATDVAGNIYIADDGGCNLRVVSTQTTSITVLGVTVAPNAIASVAGDSVSGYNGDGIPATSAEINLPHGVALDSSGNLYIADTGNNRVREVSTSGTISTVAGNGTAGYSGDGGPASSAEIAAPLGVALDASHDLYLADQMSGRGQSDYHIRIVTPGGTIRTVAGNGNVSYSGDLQTATGAQFGDPIDVAMDAAGNLYIADSVNNVIRAVNTQSSTITLLGITIPPGDIATVAGNENLHSTCTGSTIFCFGGDGGPASSALLNLPEGVAMDGDGNLYIADSGNARIRKVNTSGTISTVAGSDLIGDQNGPATGEAFNFPTSVTLDWEGNIYVSDIYSNVVRAVNTQSSTITVQGVSIPSGYIATVAGNGTAGYSGDGGAATNAELSSPIGMALDGAGNLYIADAFNDRLRKVDTGGTITTVAGNGTAGFSGDGKAATSAELIGPWGVTADASGNLYIADASSSTDLGFSALRVVNTETCAINVLGVTIAPGDIETVAGNGTEGFSGDGGPATSAMLNSPTGAALDGAGNLYISDEFNLRIRRVDAPPNTTPGFSMTTANPTVAVSQPGNSGTFTVTVTALNGFSGSVALSVMGNPAMGVSLPTSITLSPGGSQNFNVVLTSAVSLGNGNFPLNVVGTTACGLVHTLKLELEVGSSALTTPSVTVSPSPSNITTAQSLSVTIGVSGNPTPTGSVTLSSGTYISAATTLVSGSATITVPAGSLSPGTDPLTATYTPNSESSSTYNGATGSNTVMVTAAVSPQAINFMQPASPVTYSSGLTIPLVATGGASGNPVVFTIDAGSTAAGSISGSTLTVTSAGSLVIDANQAGDINYSAAPQAQRTVVVNQAVQTINFTQPTSPVIYSGTSMNVPLSATGGASGNPVVFTIDAASTATGSISGSTLTVTSTGNLVIDANQAGNTNYSAATQVQRTILVNSPNAQSINFTQPATPVTYSSGLTIPLVATGGASGNAVVFTIDGGSTGTGNISGSTLTVTNAGSFVIDANQAGNSAYSAAQQVQRTVVVNQAAQTINFTQPTTPITYSGTSIDVPLSATGGASGNPVVFTIDGSSTGTGTISGSTLTITSVGNFVIDANQAGNVDYSAATQVQRTVAVNATAPDFKVTTTTSSRSVQPGGMATYSITVADVGSSFTGTVTLSVSGLPAGVTGTFNPGSVAPGSGSGTSTLTVTIPAATNLTRPNFWPTATPVLALLFMLPFRRRRRVWRGKLLLLVASLASLVSAASLTGCGGGFGFNQSQTYTFTVTGTSGADTHSTTAQLIVQ